jgi:hypothetical protein
MNKTVYSFMLVLGAAFTVMGGPIVYREPLAGGGELEVVRESKPYIKTPPQTRSWTNEVTGAIFTRNTGGLWPDRTDIFQVFVSETSSEVHVPNRSINVASRNDCPEVEIVDIVHEPSATAFLYRTWSGPSTNQEPSLILRIVSDSPTNALNQLVYLSSPTFNFRNISGIEVPESSVASVNLTGSFDEGTFAVEMLLNFEGYWKYATNRFSGGKWTATESGPLPRTD